MLCYIILFQCCTHICYVVMLLYGRCCPLAGQNQVLNQFLYNSICSQSQARSLQHNIRAIWPIVVYSDIFPKQRGPQKLCQSIALLQKAASVCRSAIVHTPSLAFSAAGWQQCIMIPIKTLHQCHKTATTPQAAKGNQCEPCVTGPVLSSMPLK